MFPSRKHRPWNSRTNICSRWVWLNISQHWMLRKDQLLANSQHLPLAGTRYGLPWCPSMRPMWSRRRKRRWVESGESEEDQPEESGNCHHFLRSFDIPSGELTVCYWKWPFIVDFPIKNGDFPLLCSVSSPEGIYSYGMLWPWLLVN